MIWIIWCLINMGQNDKVHNDENATVKRHNDKISLSPVGIYRQVIY